VDKDFLLLGQLYQVKKLKGALATTDRLGAVQPRMLGGRFNPFTSSCPYNIIAMAPFITDHWVGRSYNMVIRIA
jgi:hypothetical protein